MASAISPIASSSAASPTGSVTRPVDTRSALPLFSRLRTAKGQSDPFRLYADLRKLGEVVPAPWGGHVVTSFRLCDRVLRDRAWLEPDKRWREGQGDATRWTAPSSREMSRTLPALNAPEHTRVRRVAQTMFGHGALAELQAPVAGFTEDLLDVIEAQLRDGGEADVHALASEELPIATIGRWLELPVADHPRLRELTHEQVYTQELLPTTSQLERSDASTAELRRYFTALVQDRRRHPGDDPVSYWIARWDEIEPDRAVADEAVYYLALFVLLAALETTATLLTHSVLRLIQHPGQWNKAAAEPESVAAAVEEGLRFDPPTHVISRVAGNDAVLGGTRVREGQMVHLMIGAANRDPDRHHDPDTYDLRRKPAHLSFSGGIHYCLGAPLARLEAETLLGGLLRRFPELRLAQPPAWEARRVAFRRPTSLMLALG